MRASCLECVEKHAGAAYVLFAESWHEKHKFHRLRAIGHLHEAEDESQAWPELRELLRDSRIRFQADGQPPDWAAIEEMIAIIRPPDQRLRP